MSLQVVISSCKMQRNGGFEIKPPFPIGVLKRLLYDGFFSFAVVRQVQFYLLLMRCVSLSLGKLSVVNRIVKGSVQFLARRIVADVDGLAVLFRYINSSVGGIMA